MPRPRRAARNRRPAITEGERLWAFGHLAKDHPQYGEVTYFTFADRLHEVWDELRDEVVAEWIRENPGTRPALWWKYDAPEPRQRVGGAGDDISEVLAYAPRSNRGIPVQWFTSEEVALFGKTVRNHEHGRAPVALDPDDPPRFESEAAYLDRRGLLTTPERRRLDVSGWPKPEAVKYDDPTILTTTS